MTEMHETEEQNKNRPNLLTAVRDLIELYYPALCLIILFFSFLIGIFSRYILKNPQAWTYELSTICFVNLVVASWPYVQREHRHIIFDMFYEKQSNRTKRIMRIIANTLIALSATALLPAACSYLCDMKDLTTQVIHMPRWLVFSCFAVSFALSAVRSIMDVTEDLKPSMKGVKDT